MSLKTKILEQAKGREWFAVKRTSTTKSYQFYEPNEQNITTIKEIAPIKGNFEVIKLIEAAPALALIEKLAEALEKADEALAYYAEYNPHKPVTGYIPAGRRPAKEARAAIRRVIGE